MNGKIGFLALVLLVGSLFLVAALPAGAQSPRTPFTATLCTRVIDEGSDLIWMGNGPIVHIEGRILQFYIVDSDDPRVTGSTITSWVTTDTINFRTSIVTATAIYEGVSANPEGGWFGRITVRLADFGYVALHRNLVIHGTGALKGLEVHVMGISDIPLPENCPEGYTGGGYWEDAYLIDTTGN
jgi:hypothetical protein